MYEPLGQGIKHIKVIGVGHMAYLRVLQGKTKFSVQVMKKKNLSSFKIIISYQSLSSNNVDKDKSMTFQNWFIKVYCVKLMFL